MAPAVTDELPVLTVWAAGGNRWRMVGQISAYESLTFRPEDNGIGAWSLTMDYTDEATQLVEGRLVTIDWRGVRTTWDVVPHPKSDDATGQPQLEVSGVSALARLGWDIAWPDPTKAIASQPVLTDTDPAPYKGSAETVVKSLVRGNLVNRRGMALTVRPDLARGTTQTARPVFDNLLELTTNLAKLGRISLDLNLVSTGGKGATTADLVFDVHTPADKTRSVVLTAAAGTLDAWEQIETEPTVTMAIVGGAGTGGADRVFSIVTTPASIAAANAWGGHRVVLVDGPQSFDPDELTQAGQQALLDGAATRTLQLTAADSDGQQAFRDYVPGDKASGEVVTGATVQDVITSIEVTISADEGVSVVPTFGDPSATDAQLDMADQLGKLKQAVRRLERK